MHETLSLNFNGYIDGVKNVDGSIIIHGWVMATDPYAESDITVLTKDCNLPCKTVLYQRKDVYAFYSQKHIGYLNSGFQITIPTTFSDFWIRIKNEPVFFIKNTNTKEALVDDVIKLNPRSSRELVVVDNFYQDPNIVREYALKQEFKSNEAYHKGNRTEKHYIPSWAADEFGRLLGKKVTEFVGATGVFQYCVARDSVVYHYDTQQYAAMVYLSPDAPLQTGTQTFRSKITGLYGAATDEDSIRFKKSKKELDSLSFNGDNFYDRHNMELVDSIANIYNRCVIFNARTLHAATSYYGSNKENSRLFHLYFFNCE